MTTEYSLQAQALVQLNPEVFRPAFDAWLNRNWPIFMAFEHHAMQVWNRGRRHYSARTIVEYLRHHTVLTENGSVFKINDHSLPDLARLYLMLHPEHAGLFELRHVERKASIPMSQAGAVAAEAYRQAKEVA